MNIVMVSGEVVRDPELRYTTQGTAMLSFTVAAKHKAREKDYTTFLRCVAWDTVADAANAMMSKGSTVMVSGRINTRSYEDKAGKKQYVTEIVVNEVHLLGAAKPPAAKPRHDENMNEDSYDPNDDLPF